MFSLPVQHPESCLVQEVQSAAARKFVDDSDDVSRTVCLLWHPAVCAARHSAHARRARHPADPLTDNLPARSRRSPPAAPTVNVSAAASHQEHTASCCDCTDCLSRFRTACTAECACVAARHDALLNPPLLQGRQRMGTTFRVIEQIGLSRLESAVLCDRPDRIRFGSAAPKFVRLPRVYRCHTTSRSLTRMSTEAATAFCCCCCCCCCCC